MSPSSDPTLTSAQRAAERLGGALVDAGMARMPARVFAAAMVDEDGRVTAAELADFLGVSAGGVSGAVRMLAQLGFLRRERDRGSRRDVYVIEEDAWHEAMTRRDQSYAPIKAALVAAGDLVGKKHPARQRLEIAREFLDFVEAELADVLDRWEERMRAHGDEPRQ